MQLNGLSNLLSSETTREFKLSCGFSLTLRKFRLGDYARRDDEVLRLRLKVPPFELPENASDEIKTAIIESIKTTIKERVERPYVPLFEEDFEFGDSMHGKAFDLKLICAEPKLNIDQARHIVESFSDEDREEYESLLDWAREIGPVGNSDSPSEERNDGDQKTTSISNGES